MEMFTDIIIYFSSENEKVRSNFIYIDDYLCVLLPQNSYDKVNNKVNNNVVNICSKKVKTINQKQKRIDLRVTEEQKELLERAANLKGVSLSSYLLSNSLTMARMDLEQHHKLILADCDRDLFLDLINNPPEANEALLKAMNNLNQEEKELLNSVENDEWDSIKNVEIAKNIYQSYAQEYLQKSVKVILSQEDQEKLTALADRLGTSPSNLTGEIVHKYLQGLLIEKTA